MSAALRRPNVLLGLGDRPDADGTVAGFADVGVPNQDGPVFLDHEVRAAVYG